MAPSIYLAGPDVFHPEAARLGREKEAICAAHALVGLFPLDAEIPPDTSTQSRAIYAACAAMMRAADAGIFNLTPFRGPSADVSTVFELGAMHAMGKPVFAYSNVSSDLIERLRLAPGLARDSYDVWRDGDGMSAEDFGNADNLMIDEALATQGRKVLRFAAAPGVRFTALDAFAACVAEAVAYFAASG